MSFSKFLAIDIGAESGRAIVGILDNSKITLEEIYRFPNYQNKNSSGCFWDFDYLFQELKKSISTTILSGHADIESVGIDTWGVDFGLIGFDGNLLEMPYSYRDKRTDGIPELVYKHIDCDSLYKQTGVQSMQINTLFQLFYLSLSNKEILKETNKLLFMPDLFNFFLTGKKYSEYTIASTSQLLNVFTKSFDENIFLTLNLPTNITAPIIKPGTIVGELKNEINRELGLKKLDVVAVASHDTASAVAAIPAKGSNWAFLSSGTWSVLGKELKKPITDISFKNTFTNEGGINDTFRYLSNTSGMWVIQQLKKKWNEEGLNLSINEIIELAEKENSTHQIVDLDDKIFVNPENMKQAIDEYCLRKKIALPNKPGNYARLIFESLAAKYASVIDKLEAASKIKIDILHIVGGGSQNNFLNKLTSNSTGKKIIAGPSEATACGNILMQAVAKGKFSSIKNIREVIAKSFSLKIYNPDG